MWQKVAVGVLTALFAGAIAAIAQSDWPPWAGTARLNGVSSEVLYGDIRMEWRAYCEADRMKNRLAAVAVQQDLDRLELQYSALNGGREVALRPCP